MTTLQELKKAINNKNLEDSLLVFCCEDNYFLAYQYVQAIAEFKELEISTYDDFDEQFLDIENSMFDFTAIDNLKVFVLNEFSTKIKSEKLSDIKNAIVICNKVESKTLKMIKELEMYFEFPKLQDWQIEEYMHQCCKGLSENKIKWLCKISENDIYRLDKEMKKISCFDVEQQDDVFDMINLDDGYNDLSDIKMWDLCNAISARNCLEVRAILKDIDNIDMSAFGLVTVLRRTFKNILNVQLDSSATAEKLNMKPVQFRIIKSKNCFKYSDSELKELFKFLTDFDYLVKSGNLDIDSDLLIDYIICRILS